MKAATRSAYGPPSVLQVREVDKSSPNENEVRVSVQAATVNRTDVALLTAQPFIMRFITGVFRPKSPFVGTDFAGVVEAVGSKVNAFKVGDKVWGFDDSGIGSHAQYISFPASKAILPMPEGVSFEEAAASIEGTHYAYNFINKVKLSEGQHVLVNGATGAIGSALVQFLKHFKLKVTAVCRTEHMELVKSIGADKVIDYLKEDFTRDDQQYHYVFDAVGKSTFGKCKPLLYPKGVYISSELGPHAQNPFLALATPLLGGKKVVFPIPLNIRESMVFVKNLMEQKAFRPLIDRRYPLEQIAEAYAYVASGQKVGNVIMLPNGRDELYISSGRH